MKNLKRNAFMLVGAFLIGIPIIGVFAMTLNLGQNQDLVTKSVPTRGGAAVSMMAEEVDMERAAPAVGMVADRGVMPVEPPLPPYGDEDFTPGVERTIIKTANLGLVVEDTRAAVDRVVQIVSGVDGVVTASNIYESVHTQGATSADMTLRVPIEQLDGTVAQLKQLAEKVVIESVNADDRTEQRVDLEAQLRNLQATEQQMLTIMEQATEIEDVLNVQRELNSIRGQIERLDARLQNLTGAAAMSTIHVNLTTEESELPVVNPGQPSVWQEVKISFRQAVQFYRNLFVAGLRLSIVGGPLAVIGLIGLNLWNRRNTEEEK